MKRILGKIFYLVFFTIFSCSFLLIEESYSFYLFSIWAFFLFVFSVFLNKKLDKTVLFSLLLVFLFFLSTLFSSHIPFSLEKFVFYFLSLSIFIFFRLLSGEFFNKRLFFYYLSLSTLVFNVLVVFFTFSPGFETFFSGMNMLVRTYGHNHYSSYLLLVIPVFWWQFLFSKDEEWISKSGSKFLSVILLLSSYLIMVLSLSRVNLLILLFQLFAILILFRKQIFCVSQSKIIKSIVKTSIFSLIVGVVLFLLLTLIKVENINFICNLNISNKDLCVSVVDDMRFIYWKRAFVVFKDNLIFGSGLKTFSFSSRFIPDGDFKITSYAHNTFFHNLAEGGILAGGFYIFYIFYLYIRSFSTVKKSKDQLSIFLFLAISASLINSFFDFDWNFFIIFTLVLIFISIILFDDLPQKKSKIKYSFYFLFLVFVTLFFSISVFISDLLKKSEHFDYVIKYTPFLEEQITYLSNNKILSKDYLEQLYPIYKNDPRFIRKLAQSNVFTEEERIEFYLELSDLDPISFVKVLDLSEFKTLESKKLADRYFYLVENYNLFKNYDLISNSERLKLFKQLISLSNSFYENGDFSSAAELYKKSMILNPFITNDVKVAFLEEHEIEKSISFLKLFSDFKAEAMHENFDEYMLLYSNVLIYLFKEDRLEEFFVLADPIIEQQSGFLTFLLEDLSRISNRDEDKNNFDLVFQYYGDALNY